MNRPAKSSQFHKHPKGPSRDFKPGQIIRIFFEPSGGQCDYAEFVKFTEWGLIVSDELQEGDHEPPTGTHFYPWRMIIQVSHYPEDQK